MVIFIADKLVGAGILAMIIPMTVIITAGISTAIGLEKLSILKVSVLCRS